MTNENRSALQGTELYLIDSDIIKRVHDAMYLRSEVIFPNNHNFVGNIVDIPMFYWGKTNINWCT